jgi:nucleotide-binding universal stress UspA family protein
MIPSIGLMYKSIVVGTDGSATADKALATAIELAAATGASIHLVAAYAAPRTASLASAVTTASEPQPDRAAAAESLLARSADGVRSQGVECRTHARPGEPAAVLLDVAEQQNADLIVVGNRGMTGSRRFLLGSVPDKVSHHTRCSVLIVRTS